MENLAEELSAAHKEARYWRERCAEAEDRLRFREEGEPSRLEDENRKLQEEVQWVHRENQILQAQLDIVYRIFPDPMDRY